MYKLSTGVFDGTCNITLQEEVIKLAMCGLSLKECGDYFGIDPDTWQEFCKDNPLTEERHNTGRARGIALAGQKLMNEIKGGKITAIMFYLKTQGNFEEKSTLRFENSLKVTNLPIPPMPIDPVEASKAYRQYIQDS